MKEEISKDRNIDVTTIITRDNNDNSQRQDKIEESHRRSETDRRDSKALCQCYR